MTLPWLSRRCLLAGLALAAPARARGAGWKPTRPVTLVVPFAAGSGTDGVARIVAPLLAEEIGGTVVIENRPGANGAIAAVAVARAVPDGHTLFMTTNTTHSANPALLRQIDYDPVRDFAPVARLGNPAFLLVVGPEVPARDVASFIAWAKGKPGGVNCASANAIGVVGMATLARLAGFQATTAPYRSAPQALTDVIGGRIDAMMIDITASLGHIREGRLRALAVTTRERSALMPDLPSLHEAGVEGFDLAAWNGVFAPAGTPGEVTGALGDALVRVLQRPPVVQRLAGIGFEALPAGPAPLAALVERELPRWAEMARAAGIEPE
ncbi:tripartite tricarboxylate transporter substrate binding protein [Roseomonas sp. ACRSG]|nr:tripartite tricarboxylate transporter substrate binding protein [Roseomonas sp. ACRSG]